ncbi:MAG: CDP-2,3-bis-(O-geranylgeranyl)-sn-glycerol synthase [Thermoplasmata archaeon]|nr:CDP-2,3-bis-(O-geranylgeranyl)-sn-glycerol synthase [Thermoplasmata archaeon]
MLNPIFASALAVLWLMIPVYIANAFATIPKGRGPPMDLGWTWPWDGRRILGPSKTWSGFLFAGFATIPFGLFLAWLILVAPPVWQVVPVLTPTVWDAIPLAALLSFGAMTGDALGSFVKRRLNRSSGSRTIFLDQLPFVVVPIALGLIFYRSLFWGVFGSVEAVLWLIFYTLVLHALFNWIGYKVGLKKVPW